MSFSEATGQSVALREAAALDCEKNADLRQGKADRRKEAADLQREAQNLREEAARLRKKVMRINSKTARAKAELSVETQELLREANEQLVIATVRAQTMAEVAEHTARQMAHMAEHDCLTGLPNRALLNDRLERSIALASRQGRKIALM